MMIRAAVALVLAGVVSLAGCGKSGQGAQKTDKLFIGISLPPGGKNGGCWTGRPLKKPLRSLFYDCDGKIIQDGGAAFRQGNKLALAPFAARIKSVFPLKIYILPPEFYHLAYAPALGKLSWARVFSHIILSNIPAVWL